MAGCRPKKLTPEEKKKAEKREAKRRAGKDLRGVVKAADKGARERDRRIEELFADEW